jgi:tetratricopeptide (TPR) repeat protein
MAAMFYLTSILFYIKARMSGMGKSGTTMKATALYGLAIVCGLLAFLSKENTASLPFAILLVDILLLDRTRRGMRKRLPLFAIALLMWAIFVIHVSGILGSGSERTGFFEDIHDRMRETEIVSRWQYFCTQLNVIVIYIRMLVLPLGQNIDHLYPFKDGFFDGYTPLAFLFLTGVIALGIKSIKNHLPVALGIFWFFIALSVESSLIPISDPMVEHRLYLPMFGFALVLAYLVFLLFSKERIKLLITSFLIVLVFGTTTYLRNRVYKDNMSLWLDSVSKNPKNHRAIGSLGLALYHQGRLDDAESRYKEALEIYPGYAKIYHNLGKVAKDRGQYDEAISYYRKALRIDPGFVKAHVNLGVVLQGRGKLDEAISHYNEALSIDPGHVESHNNLAAVLYGKGRFQEAIKHYNEALKSSPYFAKIHFNLGLALEQSGNLSEAVHYYRKALKIEPDLLEAHNQLGAILARHGEKGQALKHFQEVVRIKPDLASGHANLGVLLMREKRWSEAVKAFSRALEIQPDDTEARRNMELAVRKRDEKR